MASKAIIYGNDCRRAILRGVEKIARAVAVTMGPYGRMVCIEKWDLTPTVTNDGVTVAKEINLPDPWEDMGVRLCKEVSSRTNEISGDGTTTSTVLCSTLLRESLREISAGHDILGILKGLEDASYLVQAWLEEHALPVKTHTDVARIASMASHDDKIGSLIADAMDEVGRDGVITVEDGQKVETYIESTEGADFQAGFERDEFINTDAGTCVLSNPYIVCYDGRMDSPLAAANILNAALKVNQPVLFLADDFSMDVLATLTQNMKQGVISSCAVKTPMHGEKRTALLEDIAIITGGEVCSARKGDKILEWSLEKCGTAAKVQVARRKTIIINGDGEESSLMERIERLRYEQSMSPSEYDRSKIGERLARLTGGVTIIRVGSTTETAMRQVKRSIEDALASTKSAIEEGVLPGGGVAYLQIAASILREELQDDSLEDSIKAGFRIAVAALESPFRTILHNSGFEPGSYVQTIRENEESVWKGLNVKTGSWCDMFEAGLLDPRKVLRVAWENAVSFAQTVLKVEVALTPVNAAEQDLQPQEV